VGHQKPFELAIQRLSAFAEAGADCLYAPGVSEPSQILAIVKAVAPKPVNVLVSRPDPNLTLARLTDIGVRRISVGSALARVAWGAFIQAAESIKSKGEFDSLAGGASSAELNRLFHLK
jgi:2-methylisocitrate lyase-like PEP mutase family enzyme